jgi:hypothetical protein
MYHLAQVETPKDKNVVKLKVEIRFLAILIVFILVQCNDKFCQVYVHPRTECQQCKSPGARVLVVDLYTIREREREREKKINEHEV